MNKHVLSRDADKRTDLTDYAVLFWTVGACSIVYRLQNRQVETVAVMQGSRVIPSFPHSREHS